MKNIFLIIVTIFHMNTAFANLEEIFSNAENGDQCQSDYQCQSLCCDQSKGLCNPHDPANPDCSNAIDP